MNLKRYYLSYINISIRRRHSTPQNIGCFRLIKEENQIRQTHGAAVWRPVVKLPEFCFPVVRTHAKMVGAFRVKCYGKLNPEEHQEDLPLQRRRRKEVQEKEEGRRGRGEEGQPADH